jgi:hypothetical protein
MIEREYALVGDRKKRMNLKTKILKGPIHVRAAGPDLFLKELSATCDVVEGRQFVISFGTVFNTDGRGAMQVVE